MLTQGLGEDQDNNNNADEEEESEEKQGKALALVTPPVKIKAKIVKIIEPKVRKDTKKVTPTPLSSYTIETKNQGSGSSKC